MAVNNSIVLSTNTYFDTFVWASIYGVLVFYLVWVLIPLMVENIEGMIEQLRTKEDNKKSNSVQNKGS